MRKFSYINTCHFKKNPLDKCLYHSFNPYEVFLKIQSMAILKEKVLNVHHWTDKTFSFKTTRKMVNKHGNNNIKKKENRNSLKYIFKKLENIKRK